MLKKILSSALQGAFWILPITAIIFIVLWLYEQINSFTRWVFTFTDFNLDGYQEVWMFLTISALILLLSMIGFIATTRLAGLLEDFIKRIPFYSTIKDIVSIFNSSKSDKNHVLVVAIKGFTQSGYNIGLMYSTKESIIKNHYTVTLSMSPIPNGGFMFEVHKDNILIIENANFNDNLQYLLSMGTKSFTEIMQTNSKDNLITFNDWLKNNE